LRTEVGEKVKILNMRLGTNNVLALRRSAAYFGCTQTEMLGLLLEFSNLKTKDTITAGEPAVTKFKKHLITKAGDPELMNILKGE